MRRPARLTEDQVFRLGAGITGAILMVSAGLSADFAREHMLALQSLCGAGPHPHCGWCYSAAGLALAGLAAFFAAAQPGAKLRNSGLLQIKAALPRR